jgi:hypothetical protein
VGTYLLPERLTAQRYCRLLTTVLLRLLEDTPAPVRQRLWFRYMGGYPADVKRDVPSCKYEELIV